MALPETRTNFFLGRKDNYFGITNVILSSREVPNRDERLLHTGLLRFASSIFFALDLRMRVSKTRGILAKETKI